VAGKPIRRKRTAAHGLAFGGEPIETAVLDPCDEAAELGNQA
jgi:hypothetical protein